MYIVGGTFDAEGGKPSKMVNEIYKCIRERGIMIHMVNGGNISELPLHLDNTRGYNKVIWIPNVLGDVPKMRNVKEINPTCILVGSKRNNNEYLFGELVTRALEQKLNLCIEFTKVEGVKGRKMTVFDPLGNVFYQGTSIRQMTDDLLDRLMFLGRMRRVSSKQVGEKEVPELDELFLDSIKKYAKTFHKLIQAQTTRFLGNCSTRCMRGFPSQRIDDIVFVSKRNVDKRYIDKSAFVPCNLNSECVEYYNENKPSVDTPIQLELYRRLPNINYMIHSHCYIKGAPFTQQVIPCGAIQEVDEIMATIKDTETDFHVVNLKGHGSTVMAATAEQLQKIKYIPRIFPEEFNRGSWK